MAGRTNNKQEARNALVKENTTTGMVVPLVSSGHFPPHRIISIQQRTRRLLIIKVHCQRSRRSSSTVKVSNRSRNGHGKCRILKSSTASVYLTSCHSLALYLLPCPSALYSLSICIPCLRVYPWVRGRGRGW